MTDPRPVVLDAGLSSPSSSPMLAQRLAVATQAAAGIPIEPVTISLRERAADIGASMAAGFAVGSAAEAG